MNWEFNKKLLTRKDKTPMKNNNDEIQENDLYEQAWLLWNKVNDWITQLILKKQNSPKKNLFLKKAA